MSTPPFLSHATPSGSTVQHSQGLNSREDCHLEHRHFTATSGYGSATIAARESQCLEPSTGDDYAVSVFEVLQLSSPPVILAPPLARDSSLVGNSSEEPDSAQVSLSLGCVAGQNKASTDSPLVNHTYGYWDMQVYPSDYVMDPTYAIEPSSGYPQESGDVSTFGDLDNNFAGPTMYLDPIPSLHDCTSSQVIGSDAPLSRLSNPLLSSLQELHPSNDFTIGNIPPQPEQTRTEIEQIRPWTPFSYTYPIPSQSKSTSYPASDGYVSSYPSFPMLNQNSSSWSPHEHLGYPIPIHPHYTTPVDPPGFHGFDTGSKMELHTLGILDDYAALTLGDHPSRTLSDYKTLLS